MIFYRVCIYKSTFSLSFVNWELGCPLLECPLSRVNSPLSSKWWYHIHYTNRGTSDKGLSIFEQRNKGLINFCQLQYMHVYSVNGACKKCLTAERKMGAGQEAVPARA